MTGQEMYEFFNHGVGYKVAVPFEDLPELYSDTWNRLALAASPSVAERDTLADTAKSLGYALRPLCIEISQGRAMPKDYLEVTTKENAAKGIRVGVLRLKP